MHQQFQDEDQEFEEEEEEKEGEDKIDDNDDDDEAEDEEIYMAEGAADFWRNFSSLDLSPLELAAEYIVRRSLDMSNFIRVLENYYAIRGMAPVLARKLALQSVLGTGKGDPDYLFEESEESSSVGKDSFQQTALASKRYLEKMKKRNSILHQILLKLEEKVALTFQRHFSRRISAVKIPSLKEMVL